MIISIINFSSFVIACFFMGYLYLLSIQPVKRAEKLGEKAWNNCKKLRSFGGLFELISVINLFLWIWFPLPVLDMWIISPNIWVGIIIAICILIPCGIIMGMGIKAAGSETLTPSKDTTMYRGIYKFIRHPQTLGEFPMFVAISFALNSCFLVIFSFVFILIYIPIMIHYEEKDLVRRFGNDYVQYQKTTGVLFPKLKKNIEK